MSYSELPLKSSGSRDVDDVSVTDLVDCCPSSSISSLKPGSKVSSAPFSSTRSPSIPLKFQQSLLTLIHLHFLSRMLEASPEWKRDEPHRALRTLKTVLPTFFSQVGYVSHYFFESVFLATKMFFLRNTFHVIPENLPQLFSIASFFQSRCTICILTCFSYLLC
ncbi:hypothetical protein GEMRC1_005495 [Eukaryota sp. GEM-RC1]